MKCDYASATSELGVRLAVPSREEKLKQADAWLKEILIACPNEDATWRILFQVVVSQIESGKTIIIVREGSMSKLHRLMVIVFGTLAGLCVIGGIIAIIWNSAAPTQFSMLGVKLSTGHVGVAFVGIGMVTAYFTFSNILKSGNTKNK